MWNGLNTGLDLIEICAYLFWLLQLLLLYILYYHVMEDLMIPDYVVNSDCVYILWKKIKYKNHLWINSFKNCDNDKLFWQKWMGQSLDKSLAKYFLNRLFSKMDGKKWMDPPRIFHFCEYLAIKGFNKNDGQIYFILSPGKIFFHIFPQKNIQKNVDIFGAFLHCLYPDYVSTEWQCPSSRLL